MPKHLDVDWPYAESLYLQGLSMEMVAAELGVNYSTMKGYALRHQWTTKRKNLPSLPGKVAARCLKTLAIELKDKLATDAERTMEALDRHDPRGMSLERLEQRERIATNLQKRTFSTLGLDTAQPDNVFNVNVMNALAEQYLNQSINVENQTNAEAVVEGGSTVEAQAITDQTQPK